jgi:hypothetical protein
MILFRIKQKDGKWYVLKRKHRILRKDTWEPFVRYRGSRDAYPHKTYEGAQKALEEEVIWHYTDVIYEKK